MPSSAIVFSKGGCPWCKKALNLLDEVEIECWNIELPAGQSISTYFPTQTTVPQIILDGVHIGGCTDLYQLLGKPAEDGEGKGCSDTSCRDTPPASPREVDSTPIDDRCALELIQARQEFGLEYLYHSRLSWKLRMNQILVAQAASLLNVEQVYLLEYSPAFVGPLTLRLPLPPRTVVGVWANGASHIDDQPLPIGQVHWQRSTAAGSVILHATGVLALLMYTDQPPVYGSESWLKKITDWQAGDKYSGKGYYHNLGTHQIVSSAFINGYLGQRTPPDDKALVALGLLSKEKK
jgi:glutaredoxin 3